MTGIDSPPAPAPPHSPRDDGEGERQLKVVLGDLWQHAETLVRQEVALAKAEYEARVTHAKAALSRAAISLGLFHAAYLTMLATLVLVLAQWLEPWLASLIIAVGASTGAVIFTRLGKQALEQATEEPHARHLPTSLKRQRAHS